MSRHPPGRKIMIVRGDTKKFYLSVIYGQDCVPYEVETGDIFRFTVKKYLYDHDPLISKEIIVEDPESTMLELAPEDTKDLLFGEYHYNLELTTTEGDVYTIIPDSLFMVLPKV